MIIPSSSFGVIASSRPRAAAGPAGDVTPNPINFSTSIGFAGITTYYSIKRITGITVPITLRFSYGGSFTLYVAVLQSATEGDSISSPSQPSVFGSIVANNGTVVINNNEYLRIAAAGSVDPDSTLLTITNVSDGDAVLDTVYLDYSS